MLSLEGIPMNPLIQPDRLFDENRVLQESGTFYLKPLSHQVFRLINYTGTCLKQNQYPRLGKGLMVAGYFLNTLIASIEAIACFIFTLLASGIDVLARNRFQKIKDLTAKIYTYQVNTLLIAGVQIYCLKKDMFSSLHTLNAFLNYLIQGISSAIGQYTNNQLGLFYPKYVEEDDHPFNLTNEQEIRILFGILPAAIRDMTLGAARDFSHHLEQQHPRFQVFIQQNPPYEVILNQFSFEQLRNHDYRRQLYNIFAHYFQHIQLIRAVPQQVPLEEVAPLYQLNQGEKDQNYQNYLKTLIKNAFIQLYNTPRYLQQISPLHNENEALADGREKLMSYIATIEFAHFAQLQEIKEMIVCPDAFDAQNLQRYNERRLNLLETRRKWLELTQDEVEILHTKLLQTGNFNLNQQEISKERAAFIQEIFNSIGALAGELHQGDLLSLRYVDINLLNEGDFNGAFAAQNLFQGACQEAVSEIEAEESS